MLPQRVFCPLDRDNRGYLFMTKKLIQTLIVAVCILLIAPIETLAAENNDNHKKLIVKTAQKLGVDPYVALSIAKIESNFDATVKSPGGAVGLFQLSPGTAKKLGINPYIVSENIEGGIKYYKMLYKKYGSMDLALAAYNAGPGNVAKYNGVPPFTTTKNFIKNIKKEYDTFKTDETTKTIISDML